MTACGASTRRCAQLLVGADRRAEGSADRLRHGHRRARRRPTCKQATVYVSVLGSEKKRERTLDGLQAAHGVLQAQIGRELRLKRTPTLTAIRRASFVVLLLQHGEAAAHGLDDSG